MNVRRRVWWVLIACLVALVAAACAERKEPPAEKWVGRFPESLSAYEPVVGYASATSYAYPSTITLYIGAIDSTPRTVTVSIQNMDPATLNWQTISSQPFSALALTYPADAAESGCGWESVPGASLSIPTGADWKPGLYRAAIYQIGPGPVLISWIEFVIKASEPNSASILVVWPTATVQAYNGWDKNDDMASDGSLYDSYAPRRNRRVSLRRPVNRDVRFAATGNDRRLANSTAYQPEMGIYRWLLANAQANGWTFNHWTSEDLDSNVATTIQNYQLVIFMGHDEYWSKNMRDHMEGAISTLRAGDGKFSNAAFFTANAAWWQIRYENNYTNMVSYKSAIEDPMVDTDDTVVTANWASPPINRPENSLTGVSYRYGTQFVQGNCTTCTPPTDYTVLPDANNQWAYRLFGGIFAPDAGGSLNVQAFSYETDAMRWTLDGGNSAPEGRDGTPLNTAKLASADLRGFIDQGQGGSATMTIYRHGSGYAFSVGTVEWLRVLKLDGPMGSAPADVLTKNVVNNLKTPWTAPAGPTWAPPARRSPGLGSDQKYWTQRGDVLPSYRLYAFAGNIEGHLFGITQGAGAGLYRAEPELLASENNPQWSLIANQNTPPYFPTAMTSPWRNERIYLATYNDAQVRFFSRTPTLTVEDWRDDTIPLGTPPPGQPLRGLACGAGGELYALRDGSSSDGMRLWYQPGGWQTPGRAPANATSMTYVDDKLFVIDNVGTLYCRQNLWGFDLRWVKVAANTSLSGSTLLAAHIGKLFAVNYTLGPRLFWRAAVATDGALRAGKLLFYNASSGVGRVSRFGGDARVTRLQDYPDPAKQHAAFGTGWTLITTDSNGTLVFYQQGTGAVATGKISEDPAHEGEFTTLQYWNPYFGTDWTQMEGTFNGNGSIIIYRKSDGFAATFTVLPNSGVITVNWYGNLGAGWDRIVPTWEGQIFFYRKDTGLLQSSTMNGNVVNPPTGSWSPGSGFTHVTPLGTAYLFFYQNVLPGTIEIVEYGRNAPTCSVQYSNTFVVGGNVVGGANGLLLSYLPGSVQNSRAIWGTYRDGTQFDAIKDYTSTGLLGDGWTHIVPQIKPHSGN